MAELIYDAHAHIFPEKIAAKATKSIGQFYDIPMDHVGLSEQLLQSGEKIGVAKYLVCSSATAPAQVEPINNFIIDVCKKYPKFLGFGTMHPGYIGIEKEIARLSEIGIKGIKLHPDFQHFHIDDEDAMPIYRAAEKYNMKILFHTGDCRYDFSSPKRLRPVAEKFPDLICIAAHFGAYSEWETPRDYLKRDNVYFDTSSSLFKLPVEDAMEMIDFFGADKFMFGSDFPMWDHIGELERFNTLPLTKRERKMILSENFERLYLQ